MSTLAQTILAMLTVFVGRELEPVYIAHLRQHPLGAELRALQLAAHHEQAAHVVGLDVALLVALDYDESGLDHGRVSPAGALGASQLHPASRWGRSWAAEAKAESDGAREALNTLWGAYALRDALDACDGELGPALGFYRSGRCVEGPRARRTLAVARWLAWHLQVHQ